LMMSSHRGPTSYLAFASRWRPTRAEAQNETHPDGIPSDTVKTSGTSFTSAPLPTRQSHDRRFALQSPNPTAIQYLKVILLGDSTQSSTRLAAVYSCSTFRGLVVLPIVFELSPDVDTYRLEAGRLGCRRSSFDFPYDIWGTSFSDSAIPRTHLPGVGYSRSSASCFQGTAEAEQRKFLADRHQEPGQRRLG
jgi:hypothetical protein